MTINIVGVTMTQPLSDPNIQTGGSFTMGGQITIAGAGDWGESGDMYFEWDQGTGSWTTIGTSGGLYHSATNPLLGLQTTVEQTITIYSDTADTYQVRVKLIEDDLTEYTTAAQTVTVSAPSNPEASAESCDHLHDGESPALTQAHALTVAEAYHLHDGESPPLIQDHILTVAETYDEHYADGLVLSQDHNLSAVQADHLHVGDGITLAQDHILTVSEAYSEQVADNISLAGAVSLENLDAVHLQLADTIGIIVTLEAAGADHILADDGPLSLAMGWPLSIASAAHLHTAAAIALVQAYLLTIQPDAIQLVSDNTQAIPNATTGLIFLTDYRSFTTSYSLKSLSPHYDFNSLTRRSSMSGLVQGAIQ